MPTKSPSEAGISCKQVDAALNRAEENLRRCWHLLVAFRKGKSNASDVHPVIELEPLLVEELFRLSKLHHALASEKRRRVEAKAHYSRAWFNRRMAFLDRQQTRIEEAIGVGRAIGNAFAWFFYQNDRELLGKHLAEPLTKTMSAGIGGIGEREFAKNARMLGSWMVLHHCVTDMLRIGDVSLINLKTLRVAGLGELKSHEYTPGKVTVSVTVLGDRPDVSLKAAVAPVDRTIDAGRDVTSQLSPAAAARLDRQLNKIQVSQAASRRTPDSLVSLITDNQMKTFEAFLQDTRKQTVSYAQTGASQTFFSWRFRKVRWARRISGAKPGTKPAPAVKERFKKLPDFVLKTMNPQRKDNALILESFFYDRTGRFELMSGMTHPFWWPIDSTLLEQVLFKDVMVFSVFNPAWLYKKFEEEGFTVEAKDIHHPRVSKSDGNMVISLEGIPFYYRAIQRYLMDEAAVIKMWQAVAKDPRFSPSGAYHRIDMNIQQKFGKPPPDAS